MNLLSFKKLKKVCFKDYPSFELLPIFKDFLMKVLIHQMKSFRFEFSKPGH